MSTEIDLVQLFKDILATCCLVGEQEVCRGKYEMLSSSSLSVFVQKSQEDLLTKKIFSRSPYKLS